MTVQVSKRTSAPAAAGPDGEGSGLSGHLVVEPNAGGQQRDEVMRETLGDQEVGSGGSHSGHSAMGRLRSSSRCWCWKSTGPVQRWVTSEKNFFKLGLRIWPMRWHSSTPAEDRPRPIRESDRKDQNKIMTSHTVPLVVTALSRHCGGYLAASSLTFLKPRFKRFLMPVSARLARAGVVANQVTTVSIVGSLIMGGMLSLFHSHSILFGLLPVWVLVRMGCAAIDGTLAIDSTLVTPVGQA